LRRAPAALLGALLAVSCASRNSSSAPSRVVVETSSGERPSVAVEVARTDPERRKGLMHREKLAPDAGMLFLFEESSEHGFWMLNTLIPLDMIFIGEDGRIVGIVERAQPRSTVMRSVGAPSRYVLEVNGGWARAHGVKAGDLVRFENVRMW
jgi:uncharacterized membrane protein (UPF0127 family)